MLHTQRPPVGVSLVLGVRIHTQDTRTNIIGNNRQDIA